MITSPPSKDLSCVTVVKWTDGSTLEQDACATLTNAFPGRVCGA